MSNYFQIIAEECSKLDILAQEYLDRFEFLPNDQICDRIYQRARAIFIENNEDFDKVPDWVASIMDGWFPYTSKGKNGSLYYSLGYSVVSQDAHLRNLLERAEGREEKELEFPVAVDKVVVEAKLGQSET